MPPDREGARGPEHRAGPNLRHGNPDNLRARRCGISYHDRTWSANRAAAPLSDNVRQTGDDPPRAHRPADWPSWGSRDVTAQYGIGARDRPGGLIPRISSNSGV